MSRCSRPKLSIIPAVVSWSTLIIFTSIFFGSSSEYLCIKYSPGIIVYEVIVLFFVILFFSLTAWTDPGIYPKASESEIRFSDPRAPLYKNIDIRGIPIRMKWCQTCKFYRPPRSSHCSVCNSCIEIFDHHCPWVNNCVGRRNYKFFCYFLFTLTVHVLNVIAFSLLHIISTRSLFQTANNILLVICIIVSALLFIPIFGLSVFHIMLISRGRTTNEQVTGKFKGGHNPFNLGCFSNCLNTFYKSPWPKLSEWNSKEIDENLKLIYEGKSNGNGLIYVDDHKLNGFNKSLEFDKTFSSMPGDTISRISSHNRTNDSDSSNRLLIPPANSSLSISAMAAMALNPNDPSKKPAIWNNKKIEGTSSGHTSGMSALTLNSNRSFNQKNARLVEKSTMSKVGLQSLGSFHSLSGNSALGTPSWGGLSMEHGSAYSINSKLDTSTSKIIVPRTPSQRRRQRALSANREKSDHQQEVIIAPIATEEAISPSSIYSNDNEVFNGLQDGYMFSNDQAFPILQPLNSPKRTKSKNKLKDDKLINVDKKSLGLVNLKNEPFKGISQSNDDSYYQLINDQPANIINNKNFKPTYNHFRNIDNVNESISKNNSYNQNSNNVSYSAANFNQNIKALKNSNNEYLLDPAIIDISNKRLKGQPNISSYSNTPSLEPLSAFTLSKKTNSSSQHNKSQTSITSVERQIRNKLEWRKPDIVSTTISQNHQVQNAWDDNISNAEILNIPGSVRRPVSFAKAVQLGENLNLTLLPNRLPVQDEEENSEKVPNIMEISV